MKKIYIILTFIFVLIFCIFYYKNQKLGNTIIKLNDEKIIEDILNGNIRYKARVKVTVYSNKNENEYQLNIEEDGEKCTIEAMNKSISGLKIEKKNGDLTIKNAKLKLDKIYEHYQEFTDDSLFLSSFAKEYHETEKKEITDEMIKITLKDANKYIKYKELHFNKETGIPTKLVIKDSSNQPKIIIEYTSIEI